MGCTLLALVLRLVRLGAQSFWIDEVLSYGWIQQIEKGGFGSLVHNIHGPLHAIAIWLMSHVSTSEAWLRVPSVVAGTLTVPAIGLFGRTLWGARVGLVAAALVTISPFALYYAQECRNYAFSMLFAVLWSWAAWIYVRRARVRDAVALGAAEFGGIASNLNALFALLGLGIWGIVVLRRRRRALAGWLALHVVVVLSLFPYALSINDQVRPERLVGVETGFGEKTALRGATTLHPLSLPYTAYAFSAGYSLGPTLAELREDPRAAARPRHLPALALVLVGFGVAVGAGVAARRPGAWLLAAPAFGSMVFTLWLAAANMKPFNVRYLAVVFPAFVLFGALGFWTLPRRVRLVCGAALVVAGVIGCFNYLFVPRYGRDDVRGAVQAVAQRAAPEDAVVQISLTASMREYYTALGSRPVHPPRSAMANRAAADAWLDQTLGDSRTAWYLECRPQAIDPQGTLREAFAARAQSVDMQDFVGVRVYRYQLAAPVP